MKYNKEKDYSERFDELWKNYGRKGNKKKAFLRWTRLTEDDKVKVERHYPFYVSTRNVQFRKHLDAYLYCEEYNNPVYFKNEVVFDPDNILTTKDDFENYQEQLEDVRWKSFRDMVLVVRGSKCEMCGSSAHLQIHHPQYISGRKAWEYTCNEVMVLCKDCHEKVHNIK